MDIKNCLQCKKSFKYGRKDKKFCNDLCRNKYNWENKHREIALKKYADNKELYKKQSNDYNYTHNEKRLLCWAKSRAIKNNLPFNIDESDIFIPEFCPLIGIKLERGSKIHNSSPTLDKIIPELGYVKGNVWVISWKANRLKSNLDQYELNSFCNVLLSKMDEISK